MSSRKHLADKRLTYFLNTTKAKSGKSTLFRTTIWSWNQFWLKVEVCKSEAPWSVTTSFVSWLWPIFLSTNNSPIKTPIHFSPCQYCIWLFDHHNKGEKAISCWILSTYIGKTSFHGASKVKQCCETERPPRRSLHVSILDSWCLIHFFKSFIVISFIFCRIFLIPNNICSRKVVFSQNISPVQLSS